VLLMVRLLVLQEQELPAVPGLLVLLLVLLLLLLLVLLLQELPVPRRQKNYKPWRQVSEP